MRSRYSAFVLGDEQYLLQSWHPDTRPQAITTDPTIGWTGLTIDGTEGGQLLDATGTVAFTASFAGGSQTEQSSFSRLNGQWVYVDGV